MKANKYIKVKALNSDFVYVRVADENTAGIVRPDMTTIVIRSPGGIISIADDVMGSIASKLDKIVINPPDGYERAYTVSASNEQTSALLFDGNSDLPKINSTWIPKFSELGGLYVRNVEGTTYSVPNVAYLNSNYLKQATGEDYDYERVYVRLQGGTTDDTRIATSSYSKAANSYVIRNEDGYVEAVCPSYDDDDVVGANEYALINYDYFKTKQARYTKSLTTGDIVPLKAVADQNGKVIDQTYMTIKDGATKAYVKEYALPKTYSDIWYLTKNGFSPDMPPEDEQGVMYTTTGEDVIEITTELGEYTYDFNPANKYTNVFKVETSVTETVSLRLETYVVIQGVERILSIGTFQDIILGSSVVNRIEVGGNFTEMLDVEIEVPEGSQLRQKLTFLGNTGTLDIVNTSVNKSTFQLGVETQVIKVNSVGSPYEYHIGSDEFTPSQSSAIYDTEYQAVIPQEKHKQPAAQNYLLWLQAVDGTVRRYVHGDFAVDEQGNITVYVTDPNLDYIVLIASKVA